MNAHSRPAFLFLLWTVVLLGPFAWTAALGIMFPMTDWVCDRGSRHAFFIAGGICLALALAAAAIGGLRLSQGHDLREGETSAERSRFLLELGIWMSALLALVIALYIVPVFLLSSCPT